MSTASNRSGRGRDVEWTKQAKADLAKLSSRDVDRIPAAVGEFARTRRGNILRMKGYDPPRSRFRVGNFRAMLELTGSLVRVVRVLHRREADRKSAWIPQEVPRVGDTGADECAESDAIVAAPELESV